jgi:hypothetical protein
MMFKETSRCLLWESNEIRSVGEMPFYLMLTCGIYSYYYTLKN